MKSKVKLDRKKPLRETKQIISRIKSLMWNKIYYDDKIYYVQKDTFKVPYVQIRNKVYSFEEGNKMKLQKVF